MSKKTININDKKINNKDFYNNKKQFKRKDIDISKILVSKPEPYGKKNAKRYIIEYNDDVMRPLHIFSPQMNGYFKCFDDNMAMSFLANDQDIFQIYTKLWGKIKDLIGKKFDSRPIYNDNYIKTEIKSCNNDIRTNFAVKIITEKYHKKIAHITAYH